MLQKEFFRTQHAESESDGTGTTSAASLHYKVSVAKVYANVPISEIYLGKMQIRLHM